MFAADWTLAWWNSVWSALFGDPVLLPDAERNAARAFFRNGVARSVLPPVHSERGPDAFAASLVADLKDAVSRYPADGRLKRLVRELRDTSGHFAELWAATATAAPHLNERKTILHPEVGEITLDCDVLLVQGDDLRVVTYTAPAGSSYAEEPDLLRVIGGPSARAHL